ncbi:MAG: hypothetical protein ABSE21_04235 [Bryobacteraceae bacterium]|jgi:hypothetical protein
MRLQVSARKLGGCCAMAMLGCAVLALPARAEERSIVFVFGPSGAETARQTARAAAGTARQWLKNPGASAEIRRAGSTEVQEIDTKWTAKKYDEVFLDAARQARESDAAAFLSAVDLASQVLSHRTGMRLIVAVLEGPPLSGDAEGMVKQIVEFCQTNGVRVVVLDAGQRDAKKASAALQSMARETGGAWVRNANALESSVLMLAPTKRAGSETDAEPAASAAATPQAPAPALATPLAAGANAQASMDTPPPPPVHVRFFRTSALGTQMRGTERSALGSGPVAGMVVSDAGEAIESNIGPMQGLLLVESPISALKFDIDDHAGTYLGRARITQIARNAAGKAVWTAKKEVTLRGPLQKLSARLTGNLYYMRTVQLSAGKYTLEATVEDLIAGTTGTVSAPLRTSTGVPGLTVSDAMIVRLFNGAADKFEADQVLLYDRDAIAPLLDPVFRAGELFDMRIYFVIYPDLFGGQPQLNLEIVRNGHVVGRVNLPFTDRIRDTSRDGGTIDVSSMGEQKHEFPYMATLKNSQLGAGEFEARVTIRQDKNVITRIVPFRVAGSDKGVVEKAGGPSGAAAPAEDEYAGVVLPEIDPVSIHAGATALAESDQKRLWTEAATSALGYSAHLPNFRCNQDTRRLTAPSKSPENLRESDAFKEELTYEDGKESYRTLEVNGLKSDQSRSALKGVHSRGEFGTMLKALFSPEVSAAYQWSGQAMVGGAMCEVFDVAVPPEKSNFVLYFNTRQEVAGYTGRVFIEDETGLVRRLVIQGNKLPKDFGFQSPTFSLEYGMVKVGSQDYLLPLRSVLQVRQGRIMVRNETVFEQYRKFEASSEINYHN